MFALSSGGWSLGLIHVNQKTQPTTVAEWALALMLFGGGLLALLFAWRFLAEPHEVRLGDKGTIEFLSTIGVSRTTVFEIQEVHKFVEAVALESDDSRRVRLTYAGGSRVLSNVAEIEPLLSELSKRNPNIKLRGRWPNE